MWHECTSCDRNFQHKTGISFLWKEVPLCDRNFLPWQEFPSFDRNVLPVTGVSFQDRNFLLVIGTSFLWHEFWYRILRIWGFLPSMSSISFFVWPFFIQIVTLKRGLLVKFPVRFYIFPAGNTRAPAGENNTLGINIISKNYKYSKYTWFWFFERWIISGTSINAISIKLEVEIIFFWA